MKYSLVGYWNNNWWVDTTFPPPNRLVTRSSVHVMDLHLYFGDLLPEELVRRLAEGY